MTIPDLLSRMTDPTFWQPYAAAITQALGGRSSDGRMRLLESAAPVTEAGAPPPAPAEAVVVSRNGHLIAYLLEQGLIAPETPVCAEATLADVAGKHVFGDVALPFAAAAAQVTIIPIPEAYRWGWEGCELPLEELRQVAGPPHTYQVQDVTPAPVAAPPAPAAPTTEAARPGPQRQYLYEGAAALREATPGASLDAAQGVVTFTIIRPGFNSSRSRFYTAPAVAAIAEAMRGQKMYLNHPTASDLRERPERDLGTWVSQITETWVDPADGAAKGKATITSPAFLGLVQRLAATNLLPALGASINACGLGEPSVVEGVETFRVDGVEGATDPFRSVDWVTEPGAGGRAELLEAARQHAPAASIPLEETQTMDVTQTPTPDDAAEQQEDTQTQTDIAALQKSVSDLTALVQQVISAAGLDSLLAQVPATEAAKARARAKLLTTGTTPTLESVRAAVQAEITEAASILGRAPGVQGFGAPPEGDESADPEATLRESWKAHGGNESALTAAIRQRLGD